MPDIEYISSLVILIGPDIPFTGYFLQFISVKQGNQRIKECCRRSIDHTALVVMETAVGTISSILCLCRVVVALRYFEETVIGRFVGVGSTIWVVICVDLHRLLRGVVVELIVDQFAVPVPCQACIVHTRDGSLEAVGCTSGDSLIGGQWQFGSIETDVVYEEVVARVGGGEIVDRYTRLVVVVRTEHGEAHLLPLAAFLDLACEECTYIRPIGISFVASLDIEAEDRQCTRGVVSRRGVVDPRIAIQLLSGADTRIGGYAGNQTRLHRTIDIHTIAVGGSAVLLTLCPLFIHFVHQCIFTIVGKIGCGFSGLTPHTFACPVGIEKSIGGFRPRHRFVVIGDGGGAGLLIEIEILL